MRAARTVRCDCPACAKRETERRTMLAIVGLAIGCAMMAAIELLAEWFR